MTEPVTKNDIHEKIRLMHGFGGMSIVGEALGTDRKSYCVALWTPAHETRWRTVGVGDTLEGLMADIIRRPGV